MEHIHKIYEALATVFFQEGYDRETKKHGLDYWLVDEGEKFEGNQHCKACIIDDCFCINTTKIDDQYYVRLYYVSIDEYGEFVRNKTRLLIPVDVGRLCWEEISRCGILINCIIDPSSKN